LALNHGALEGASGEIRVVYFTGGQMQEKFWGFLDSLSKQASLSMLVLSIILVIVSVADSIPILDISFPWWGKIILLLLALPMFWFSMRAIERNESSKLSNQRIEKEKRDAEELRDRFKQKAEDLEADLKTVREIISDKDDAISREIWDVIFPRIGKQLAKEELSFREIKRASEWVDQRAGTWSSNIQRTDIQDINLSDDQLNILRDEIVQYVRLLSGNVLSGSFRSPGNKEFNIPQTLKSSLIYRKAMMHIRQQMEQELENSETEKLMGGEIVCQELRKYMNVLIDDI